jgi:hypothetical protein
MDTCLANIDSILPLFDPRRLIRTIDQWYGSPTQRSHTPWAVINMVMAIVQHFSSGHVGFGHTEFASNVSDCLNKAQSALAEIPIGRCRT